MTPKFSAEKNLQELFFDFDSLLGWLREITSEQNVKRFGEIKANLVSFLKDYDSRTNTLLQETEEKPLFLSTLEAWELCEIARFLKGRDKSHLPIADIRRVFIGPAFHTEEVPKTGDTEGRNIQFEFILANFLAKKGFPILGFKDVKIGIGQWKVEIQCKRPSSPKTLKQNFEKAVDQIITSDFVKNGALGIVAVCLDKVFGLDNSVFRGNDVDGVINAISLHHTRAKNELTGQFKLSSDKRIAGVIFVAKSILWNKDSGLFSVVPTISVHRTVQEKYVGEYDEVLSILDKAVKLKDWV